METTEQLSPRAAFNKAIHLVGAGDLAQAADFCRMTLDNNPRDVSITALLGAIHLKMRQSDDAEKYLRQAIDMAPSFAKPHEDLGFLLIELGRPDEAVGILEKATRLDPKADLAWFSLGRALGMVGKGTESDAAFEKSFDLNPKRKRLALAAEHHSEGRHDEAARLYREVLRDAPNNVDAMRLLAGVHMSKGNYEEAEAMLRRAVSIAPDFTLARLDLGRLMHDQHRYREAVECFEQTIELEPLNPKASYLLAASLAPAGRTVEALESYRRTIEIRADHAAAWLGIGHTLKTVGRQDEAIEAYRHCIEIRPDNGETYWSLANLKTYKLTDADIRAMETALDKHEEIGDQSAVNFMFALAKAHEDQGDFDRAWDFYVRGNSTQRMLERYDPVQTETTNDQIIEVFDRALLEQKSGPGHPDAAPIFVLGLPRSGSTLIEQILASHSMVEGTSELPYLGRVATSLSRNRADGINYPHSVRELGPKNLEALGQQYLDMAQFHRQTERPRFVDKMPNNFPNVGLLHLILPNAKIIDARRYPLDSTLSCYRQLFAMGQSFVYDLNDIGEYFLEYQRLMDHWHKVLPGRVLTVQYEDMVTDFDNQVRRLIDYCELPWEDACASFHETDRPVRTASSEQVRQPVYTKSVHFWRNYELQLGELIDVLEPILPRYAQYESINRQD